MKKLWEDKLRTVAPYIPGEQPKLNNIIKLNANENPYPPSPGVKKTIENFDADSLRLYPDAGSHLLKKELASFHNIKPEQVFLGNGSDDVLALAFMSFFNSEKPIVFPDITYTFYPVWCGLFNIPFKRLPLNKNFRIEPYDYAPENGGVIIPNPNAPTGTCESLEFIKDILNKNPDVIVIIDEAYVDFGGHSCIPLLEQYENLLIVHTFSKSRSLAGMRIGAAFGNSQLIQVLEAVKNSYNSYTMDSIAIAAGAASVRDRGYFNETMEKIIKTRKRTAKELLSLGFNVCESNSNFLFVAHEKASAYELFEYLRNKNIFIRYFDLPRINNYLRITIGTDTEMDVLIKELSVFFTLQE